MLMVVRACAWLHAVNGIQRDVGARKLIFSGHSVLWPDLRIMKEIEIMRLFPIIVAMRVSRTCKHHSMGLPTTTYCGNVPVIDLI